MPTHMLCEAVITLHLCIFVHSVVRMCTMHLVQQFVVCRPHAGVQLLLLLFLVVVIATALTFPLAHDMM